MQRFQQTALAAVLSLAAAASAARAADLTLSSPDDLTAVSVGQTITVNVSLSNLMGDDYSFFLASPTAPNALFAAAGDPTAGPIVPDSGLVFGFADDQSDPDVITEDFNFEATTDNVIDPGVLFFFQVTADATGSGFFDFSEAPTVFLGDGSPADIMTGGPLAVTVIPEPATLGLLGLAGTGLLLRRRRA